MSKVYGLAERLYTQTLPICVGELATGINYSGGGVVHVIGASPNWVLTTDDTNSFDQATKTYTCPLEGSYEVAIVVMPDSGFTLQIFLMIEITNPDGTPFREFPLEYSRDAYHRGGYLLTPNLLKGSTIRLLLVIPTSGNPLFRGQTTVTGYTRSHNWFSIKYDPRNRVDRQIKYRC